MRRDCFLRAYAELYDFASQLEIANEVLDIGKGKGTPESILRSELNILLDDCRAIEDKLMLKGQAVLKLLYII